MLYDYNVTKIRVTLYPVGQNYKTSSPIVQPWSENFVKGRKQALLKYQRETLTSDISIYSSEPSLAAPYLGNL